MHGASWRRLLRALLALQLCPGYPHDTCESGSFSTGIMGVLRSGRGLTFCKKCHDVASLGSFVHTWDSRYNPSDYHVQGEIAYAVPNTASDDLFNIHQLEGRIVLVDRGDVPILEKVERVQEAGGIAVVLVDDGECSDGFECGSLGSRSTHNFLEQDDSFRWNHIVIPVVLILHDDGMRIKARMSLVRMDVPDLGMQYILDEL
ncbi:hypothetical protein LEN26_014136 [Aphanomyces euteiches]|nr:hypothetical protein LEN26_014136 [Aphanomyces euteiches]